MTRPAFAQPLPPRLAAKLRDNAPLTLDDHITLARCEMGEAEWQRRLAQFVENPQ